MTGAVPPDPAHDARPVIPGELHASGPHHGPTATETRLDALMPAEMASKAAEVGVRKAGLGIVPMFVLAVVAGAFIAAPADYAALDWAGLVGNLVPVTLGSIVGGTILVGAVYWLVYLRGKH